MLISLFGPKCVSISPEIGSKAVAAVEVGLQSPLDLYDPINWVFNQNVLLNNAVLLPLIIINNNNNNNN